MEFEEYGKTVGLMLQMAKIWIMGKVVTMDSGFSVSTDILAMGEKGVFSQSIASVGSRVYS